MQEVQFVRVRLWEVVAFREQYTIGHKIDDPFSELAHCERLRHLYRAWDKCSDGWEGDGLPTLSSWYAECLHWKSWSYQNGYCNQSLDWCCHKWRWRWRKLFRILVSCSNRQTVQSSQGYLLKAQRVQEIRYQQLQPNWYLHILNQSWSYYKRPHW